MSNRHKVFVSYHHANDQNYKNIFELRFGNVGDIIVRGSVGMGDIDANLQTETIRQRIRDEYLRDSSVTVVLVGTHTWQRKHVDWEIGSSIRNTAYNPRSGLLGILLPSHIENEPSIRVNSDGTIASYNAYTIPPRLHENVECGFAALYSWSNSIDVVRDRIHRAYLVKSRQSPDNSFPSFVNNRSGIRWHY